MAHRLGVSNGLLAVIANLTSIHQFYANDTFIKAQTGWFVMSQKYGVWYCFLGEIGGLGQLKQRARVRPVLCGLEL